MGRIFASRVERTIPPIQLTTQWRLLRISLAVNDTLVVGLALLLAYFFRFVPIVHVFRHDAFADYGYYQTLSVIIIPIWLVIFAAVGLYNRQNLLGGIEEYSLVFRATGYGSLVLLAAGFLQPEFILARGWLLLAWLFSFLLASGGRFFIRRGVYALRKRGYFIAPALIVGANGEGKALAQQLLQWTTSGLCVMGFVDNRLKSGTNVWGSLDSLGHTDQLDFFIKKYGITELILSNSALSREEMLVLFKKYGLVKDLNVHISSGLFEIITTGLDVREFSYVPLVRVRKGRLTGFDRVMKLILDYVITLPGLFFITPLLLLIAIAIKLDSPGPVFYKRRVMGINGNQFDAYKFRTMVVNGSEILEEHPKLLEKLALDYKLKDDPRITSMGHFLRKTSLDELPQLLNVVKRDMSLVGPRIIAPVEMEKYGDWGLNLLTVPPGITGLWQVSGRSDLSYEERVRLDMHYIRNWTIWSDLQILWQTFPAVIKGRGAY
ncbi:MAG: sugar transferase [Anaerolineae bacterium]|nr:MAG: sugar transferase [Anaerolineae bacterium]